MGKHKIRTCDHGDCFANRNYRCTALEVSIYKDCPFYKIGKMDMDRYADIKSYRYAVDRIGCLTEKMEQKRTEYRKAKTEYEEAKFALQEAKRWKKRIREKIMERMENAKT